ncbi:hypothetical protein F0562_035277 [Nyssa sinensis]|uniref:Glutathione S-transferase n=1 Tax=Nyssa sinensis TaxID=561372 RepID=A0A5J5AC72_9ASTE|nr:hypothetical protein F0562_035277 [Nyssa sinensis]
MARNPLLPSNPYDRAIARFWAKFAEDKGPVIWRMFISTGEEQEKAIKDSLEMLRTVEEEALGDKRFFSGDRIGIVDIAFGAIAHWLGVTEDIVGVKLLDANSFPRLHAWTISFKEEPVIRENLPDRDKIFANLKRRREMLLASP